MNEWDRWWMIALNYEYILSTFALETPTLSLPLSANQKKYQEWKLILKQYFILEINREGGGWGKVKKERMKGKIQCCSSICMYSPWEVLWSTGVYQPPKDFSESEQIQGARPGRIGIFQLLSLTTRESNWLFLS